MKVFLGLYRFLSASFYRGILLSVYLDRPCGGNLTRVGRNADLVD
jgi:hypothetical protein